MHRLTTLLAVSALTATAATALEAAEDPGKDLKATIVLHGQPCDEVTDSKRNADSDYTATCRDGNRYRVYVDAGGRVVVKKL